MIEVTRHHFNCVNLTILSNAPLVEGYKILHIFYGLRLQTSMQ